MGSWHYMLNHQIQQGYIFCLYHHLQSMNMKHDVKFDRYAWSWEICMYMKVQQNDLSYGSLSSLSPIFQFMYPWIRIFVKVKHGYRG